MKMKFSEKVAAIKNAPRSKKGLTTEAVARVLYRHLRNVKVQTTFGGVLAEYHIDFDALAKELVEAMSLLIDKDEHGLGSTDNSNS